MKKSMIMILLLSAAGLALAKGKAQTTCPVMAGNPINPKLYVDADGYRIYVCCGVCRKVVKANPEKYIKQMQAEGVDIAKTPGMKMSGKEMKENHSHSH